MRTVALALLFASSSTGSVYASAAFVAIDAAGKPELRYSAVGKSYDAESDRGQVMLNRAGVAKHALAVLPGATAATWESRYTSITFNQHGREQPVGGINEFGLVVEAVTFPGSSSPSAPDGRPVISELGLVQLLLDQAIDPDDVPELARGVQVVPLYAPVHYFACSQSGNCQVIEVDKGKAAPTGCPPYGGVRALDEGAGCEAFKAQWRHLEKDLQGPHGRYVQLVDKLTPKLGDRTSEAWSVLDWLRTPERTQWEIVYAPKALLVHFRTRSQPKTRTVKVSAAKTDCSKPPMVLDMNTSKSGDVTAAFAPYDEKADRAQVATMLASLKGKLPPEVEAAAAAYPGPVTCAK